MPKVDDCPFPGCTGGCSYCARVNYEAKENALLVELFETAAAWADFDHESQLRGAMTVLQRIDRPDYAEVMRSGWIEQKRKRGDAADMLPPEGQRCPHDGGKCHHNCRSRCYRKEMFMSLSQPWEGFPRDGDAPVPGAPKESPDV